MSLNSSLSIALSGIQVSSLQLEQTASNISNASTDGYTTKTVTTTSAELGLIGGGVKYTGITRAENKALFTSLSNATSESSYRDTQSTYLQKVMDILGTSNSDNPPISSALTDFIASWSTLEATPESLVNQRQVVADAVTLCDTVQSLATQIEDLDRECKNEIDSSMQDLNSYLEQIQDLNTKIAMANNSNGASGDLQDQRDQLILEVSKFVDVTVMDRGNGTIALYTNSGYQLVDGSTARSFSYDGTDVYGDTNSSMSLNSVLTGGSIQALVDFRATSTSTVSSTDISGALTNVNSYLTQIDALNTQIAAEQALGNDTTALEASRTTLVSSLNNIIGVNATDNGDGTIDVETLEGYSLIDASAGTVSSLSFDGEYITDASDATLSINKLLTGGSLEIQLASYSGSASASTDDGTNVIQKLRDQLDEIVKAFTSTVSTATSGEASFASAYNSATADTGDLASNFFTGTDRFNFSVNASLVDGTATIKLASATGVCDALADATRSFDADGLTVTSADYASLVSSSLIYFQQAASNLQTLYDTAETSRSYLEEELTNETAVNTDDQLVKLVEYQNSYAASAHVMSVIQELFQTLQNLL